MKRVLPFLRSVLPADPWQVLLLIGTVFLFISPRLTWFPDRNLPLPDSLGFAMGYDAYVRALRATVAFAYLITFSGLSAYFICFYPGPKPVRRFLYLVLFPSVVALALIVSIPFRVTHSAESVLSHPRGTFAMFLDWIRQNSGHFPLAWYSCAISLAMITIFFVRVASGSSTLPVSIAALPAVSGETNDSPRRTLLLIFALIAPLFLVQMIVALPLTISSLFWPHPSLIYSTISRIAASLISAGVLIALAVCILGRCARDDARRTVRLSELHQTFFALLLPILFSLLLTIPSYVVDRTNWAIYRVGRDFPPLFSSYIELNGLHNPWLLLLLVGAFAEELVFRGLLLRRLIFRYGFQRGVFLTGTVWAAYHFRSDSYHNLSPGGVLWHLADRVLICLAMNYVLVWMTLRWNSIIPPAIAHTVSNILVIAGVNGPVRWHNELRIAEWAVAAFLLFRYRPIVASEPAEPPLAAPPVEEESAL
jgi:membrane protease YdiL (CAAX protease family)